MGSQPHPRNDPRWGDTRGPGANETPNANGALGHRLIRAHPNSGGCEFDESEVVGVMLFEASGDGTEMLKLVEEALDQIAIAIEKGAESGDAHAAGHWFDVGPSSLLLDRRAQGITVIGPVGQKDLAGSEVAQHVLSASSIMGLALGELERDGQAVGIDERVDLGRQPAPRAPHASSSRDVPSGG